MLRVSDNRRFLVRDDGTPFFFLGDTGWTLLQRLDREEADHYLRDRAAKGFTAIQVMGISEFDGLTVPNPYGDLPLEGGDPARPNDAYFRHLDFIADRAAALGLYVALLPTWGDIEARPSGAPSGRSSPPRTPRSTAPSSARATATPRSSGSSAATATPRTSGTAPPGARWPRASTGATAAVT